MEVKVRDLEALLAELAPTDDKEPWDNVGLLCGCADAPVTGVLVALDVTLPVLEEAVSLSCEAVVTHHPLIFGEIATVTDRDPTGKLLLYAAQHGISCVNAHTNLDRAVGGVNDVLAAKLGLQNVERIGDYVRCGSVDETDLPLFAARLKEKLGCDGLRFADGGKPVHRVAVGGGACGDEIAAVAQAGCDTFVTADLKYHKFLEAELWGVNLIDAGHFETENPVASVLYDAIRAKYPSLRCVLSQRHADPTRFL
ncbi:MAG: Nif3-like dinuclear metal center hexameric protein [Oscillospiraceae bacterium]|nr:Nif3-like dinuclear metal center hexameric protein [Oscillospiraceae bacterium]